MRCARASTKPCSPRRGARRANGHSRRCSWRSIVKPGAARSSSRCWTASVEDPSRHIDLMELQYLCLALGFAGKYQVVDRGHSHLAEVQQDLYRKIRAHRGTPPSELALRWRGLQDRRNPLIRYVPWWVVGAAALAILAIAFVTYYVAPWQRRGTGRRPRSSAWASRSSVLRVRPRPWPGPTVKQLLAPEEAKRRRCAWRRKAGGRWSRCLATDLFASGSANFNRAYDRHAANRGRRPRAGAGPRARHRSHRRSAAQARSAIATTSSCPASAPSAW